MFGFFFSASNRLTAKPAYAKINIRKVINFIMEQKNNLAQYDKLAEFVDALIEQKFRDNKPDNYEELRAQLITNLDEYINKAIFDGMSTEDIDEYAALSSTEDEELQFFLRKGIDFNQKVKEAMIEFGNSFLGGNNE